MSVIMEFKQTNTISNAFVQIVTQYLQKAMFDGNTSPFPHEFFIKLHVVGPHDHL